MNLIKKLTLILTSIALLAPYSQAQAGIVIAGTRVVFPGNEREVTVKLTNAGTKPSLVQTWIDTGDILAKPEDISVPFTLSPPIFRMEPGKGQSLRMISTQEPMQQDRETVFWLNILEVPPKPAGELAEANSLQFAFRTRIKVFYRPKGLPGKVAEAPKQLAWKIVENSAGKGHALEVHNPTPYYITLSKVQLQAGSEKLDAKAGMVDPFGTLTLPLDKADAALANVMQVSYYTVNDFGGDNLHDQPITR